MGLPECSFKGDRLITLAFPLPFLLLAAWKWYSYWCCSSNPASNQDRDTERNSRTPGVLPFRIPDYLRGRSHFSHYNWAQAFKRKAAWPITALCWCCVERAGTYYSDPDPQWGSQRSLAGLAAGGVSLGISGEATGDYIKKRGKDTLFPSANTLLQELKRKEICEGKDKTGYFGLPIFSTSWKQLFWVVCEWEQLWILKEERLWKKTVQI